MTDSPLPEASPLRKARRARKAAQEPVQVILNLNLPPWPTAPASAPPVVVTSPLPPPPVFQPPPEPVPPPAPPEPWYRRLLNHVYLELADDARWFYKQVRFWLFAILCGAPDLYNAAVENHLIKGGHVPPPLEKFFNLIAFFGMATTIVKVKRGLSASVRHQEKK